MNPALDVTQTLTSIEHYKSLASSVIAQTCEDYFADGRALKHGENTKRNSKKIAEYREWFRGPDYRYWYDIISNNSEDAIIDGEMMISRLDAMVEDEDSFPGNTYNFVAAVHI